MASGRKIMIAVDDTEVSAYAFTWALHNLLRKSDQVVALTAAPYVDITYPSADLASGKPKLYSTCSFERLSITDVEKVSFSDLRKVVEVVSHKASF